MIVHIHTIILLYYDYIIIHFIEYRYIISYQSRKKEREGGSGTAELLLDNYF